MTKSSCLVCTNIIHGMGTGPASMTKREARLCQKHGATGYPQNFYCVLCKRLDRIPKTLGTSPNDPTPLNICLDCWFAGGGAAQRCSGFELD